MKPCTDIELLDSFTQSFAGLGDLHCSDNEPPPELLLSGVDPSDWNFIRWKPTKLPVPRADLEPLRRFGPLPSLFELCAVSFAWPSDYRGEKERRSAWPGQSKNCIVTGSTSYLLSGSHDPAR